MVTFTEERSEGESRDTSLRHSVARALMMARVMRSELANTQSVCAHRGEAVSGRRDSRACPCIASCSLPGVELDPLLELAPELVYLLWAVGGIVGEAGELLGVWCIFRACGEEGGAGRVACGDELDVIRCEWDMHMRPSVLCTCAGQKEGRQLREGVERRTLRRRGECRGRSSSGARGARHRSDTNLDRLFPLSIQEHGSSAQVSLDSPFIPLAAAFVEHNIH